MIAPPLYFICLSYLCLKQPKVWFLPLLGQTGTDRDRQGQEGTGRDRLGQTGTDRDIRDIKRRQEQCTCFVPAVSVLSQLVPVLSLLVPVLSLLVSVLSLVIRGITGLLPKKVCQSCLNHIKSDNGDIMMIFFHCCFEF